MTYAWEYDTPIGKILIEECDGKIIRLHFGVCKGEFELKETSILKKAGNQIREYFLKERLVFDLPFSINGTAFQIDVWNALNDIEYGKTMTYKELAIKIERISSYRAVGNANAKNPLPIFIPCHRVVKSDGSIGGYLGANDKEIGIKQYLLNLEKSNKI